MGMTATCQTNSWSVPQWVAAVQLVGRIKYRWNNLVSRDLAKCQMSEDWCERARSRDAWGWETKRNININAQAEQEEKEHKNRRKRLRKQRQTDAEASLHCN